MAGEGEAMLPLNLTLLAALALPAAGGAGGTQTEPARVSPQPMQASPQPEDVPGDRPGTVERDRKGGEAPDPVPSPPGVICTLRVVPAGPNLDPGFSRSVGRAVDPKMIVPSRCAP
jgi:hypothetical protein